MLLRSLPLCRDAATIQLISRGFKEFSVEVESCAAPEEALHKFMIQRFDAVVIDDADHAAAALLLNKLKVVPSFKNSLAIVLVDAQTALRAAFSSGTTLAIYKPLSPDRLRKSLRPLQNLIGRSRQRKCDRIPVRLPARVRLDEKTYVPALILDISQTGVALSVQQGIPNTKMVGLEFALPGRGGTIATSADVIWRNAQGRLGAQFSNMEPLSRRLLSEWAVAQLKSIQLQKGAVMAGHG